MTDQTRAVFDELRRIGADLSKPPGLALGTGFQDGEFVTWLRSLPDGLGHDGFVDRLDEHLTSSQPNVGPLLPRRPDGRPHRGWPTVEQMHAGIDILRREWDPLGARLGDLSSEDVIHHVYNLLGIVLRGGEPERVERQISARLASIEEEVFGLRPSPRAQRRYLARRFIQVVVDAPGSAHEVDPWEETMRAADASMAIARAEGRLRETRTGVTVCFGPRGDEPSKLDPTAACTECGAIGTVAVVGREVEPLYSRYCPTCWREVRDKYWDRVFSRRPKNPEEETTPEAMIAALERMSERMLFDARERVRMVGSAMWEDRAPYIERWLAPAEGESPADHEQRLRRLARDVVAEAGTMYGAMPPAIEAFVQRYASADQPPASPSDQH